MHPLTGAPGKGPQNNWIIPDEHEQLVTEAYGGGTQGEIYFCQLVVYFPDTISLYTDKELS